MTDEQRSIYRRINHHLAQAKAGGDPVHLVEAVKVMLQDRAFADWISKDKTLPPKARGTADLYQVAQRYLHRLRGRRGHTVE